VLALPFPVAAKTGTTNDFRDNWTLGYTPDLAVGVWVGNADYTPMQNTTGLTGAAPIWSQFMQEAVPRVTNNNPTPFIRPSGIMDRVICAVSGTEPSQWCPEQRNEVFASDQPPLPASDDLWKEAIIDTWSGLFATDACKDFVDKKMTMNVTDREARFWLRKMDEGRAWAKEMGFDRPIFFVPDGECKADSPHASLSIVNISEGAILTDDKKDVEVIADATGGFTTWRLEYAQGDDPGDGDWQVLFESDQRVPSAMPVVKWNLNKTGNGRWTLRLRMENKDGGYAEKVVHFKIDYTPPTPEPTAIPPTETPKPSPPTDTPPPPSPTNTSLPPSPTDTSVPPTSESPTPEPPTPEPTATP
jgi:membrane carboxypeptidase/penicillin-binding protein PbpC